MVQVSDYLGVEYLEEADSAPTWPVAGRIYGFNSRVIVTLQLAHVGWDDTAAPSRAIHVHFIVDTGSPYSYISPDVLSALDPNLQELLDADMLWKVPDLLFLLHGHLLTKLYVSSHEKSHFPGLNILGMDFLKTARASLRVDFDPDTSHRRHHKLGPEDPVVFLHGRVRTREASKYV